MAYLNLDPDYFQHPKTIQLESMLGLCTSVYPIRLWCWCAKYAKENGLLKNLTESSIEAIIGWNAEPGRAIKALKECGFLEQIGEQFRVHDWKKHEGHLEAFSIRGKRNAKLRWQKIKQKQVKYHTCQTDANSMPTECKLDALNLTKPNLTKPTDSSAVLATTQEPYELRSKEQRLMCAYKRSLGIAWDDRPWDVANFGTWVRAIKKLLTAFGGQVNPAIDFVGAYAAKMKEANRTFNAATIAKAAWDDSETSQFRIQEVKADATT